MLRIPYTHYTLIISIIIAITVTAILHVFSCCDPFVKIRLFSSFCLSLYGASLCRSSSSRLRTLEVSFNNILQKIWSLPCHSQTGIVHSVARLQNIYNMVVFRSRKLLASARRSNSTLISDLFSECAHLVYTSIIGYNNRKHLKHYTCIWLMISCVLLLYVMHRVILFSFGIHNVTLHLDSDIYCISTL